MRYSDLLAWRIIIKPRNARRWDDIIYACKSIASLARQARLASFNGSVNIHVDVYQLIAWHAARISNPDYATIFGRIRFLSIYTDADA